MRISNIKNIKFANYIIVRNYDNSIVNFPNNLKVKEKNAIGCWNNKKIEFIPKEYGYNIIWEKA